MKKFFILIISFWSTQLVAQSDYIHPSKTGAELIDSLQLNYSVTNPQSYNSARDAMFEQIDKKNGNEISCVYTGYTITFTDRQDAQGSQAASDFNTEHSWPQSFFDSDSPMRADIHHLYPTRVDVNGARNNFKFDEIPDQNTSTWYSNNSNQSSIPSSNIDEYSELLSGTSFEPREDHKGNVARAMFYFWAIYQDNSSIVTDGTDNEAFFNSMKDVLLTWHDADPVDQAEVDRSIGIENVQGNKNPFVHDTTLVRRAFFGGMAVSNEEFSTVPTLVNLNQNYPNPFNPSTIISYSLQSPQKVNLAVYDQLGRRVALLQDGFYSSGSHQVTFDAAGLSSGVYFYRLISESSVLTRKMLLLK
jgi:endonuclease I